MRSATALRVVRRTAVVAAVMSVGAGVAIAVPAVTADEAVPQIQACVSRGLLGIGKGSIRIVDRPGACTSGENALVWNQRGIQGPIGPTGPQGAAGPQGVQGVQGAQGDQGPQGVQGDTGPQGGPGPSGQQGQRGPAGLSNHQRVTASRQIGPGAVIETTVACPAGTVVLGGGFTDATPELRLSENGPSSVSSWSVTFQNTGQTTRTSHVSATCATVG